MKIPHYSVLGSSNPEALLELTPEPLPCRWSNTIPAASFSAALVLTNDHLGFACHCSHSGPLDLPQSTGFFEGLWKYSVAELFIASTRYQSYLELHLAPRGLWWLARFDGLRERSAQSLADVPIRIASRSDDGSWHAACLIPREALPLARDLKPLLRANFAACTVQGVTPSYFSFAVPVSEEPDFHRWELFLELDEHQ